MDACGSIAVGGIGRAITRGLTCALIRCRGIRISAIPNISTSEGGSIAVWSQTGTENTVADASFTIRIGRTTTSAWCTWISVVLTFTLRASNKLTRAAHNTVAVCGRGESWIHIAEVQRRESPPAVTNAIAKHKIRKVVRKLRPHTGRSDSMANTPHSEGKRNMSNGYLQTKKK